MKLLLTIMLNFFIVTAYADTMEGVAINLDIPMVVGSTELENLFMEENIESIHPVEFNADVDILFAINNVLAGIDVDMNELYNAEGTKRTDLLSVSAQVGYALVNDENKMVGVIATVGYGNINRLNKIADEEWEGSTENDSLEIGGKIVAYFPLIGGTIADVKVFPHRNLVKVTTDLDIHIFKLETRKALMKIELSPKSKLLLGENEKNLDLGIFLSLDFIIGEVAISLFNGIGINQDFIANKGSPYYKGGLSFTVSLDSWGHSKK